MDFDDLKKDERYKKLQWDLKLSRIKRGIREMTDFNLREEFKTKFNLKTSGIISPPSWPSFSSINADPSDFTSTVTPQTLKTSSEVLATSCHLRSFISKKTIQHKPITTSSVKQHLEIDKSIDDRAIIPPPSSSNIIRPPAKRSSPSNSMEPANQSRQPPSFNDDLSSHAKPSFSDVNSSIDQLGDSGCPQNQSRGKLVVRDFYRWRVVLNDQGQLLIKGILDNGKIARSKPVSKMLSSTKLESIYKHTYCLHGNIIDEKNDLPKYIYTKFYSGFPDDWENVRQIWKNYVAQGSRVTYRWPMGVSLSDDDLYSEITDITHIHKSSEKKYQESSSIDKSTSQRSSGYSSEIQQERNSKSSENLSRYVTLKAQSHFSTRNKTIEALNFSNEKENRSQDENISVGENRSENLYTVLNYAQTLRDFIFEDELKIICQTLLNENCPREYARCVKEITENLNYLTSCKITNIDESETKRPKLDSKNNSRIVEDFQRNYLTPLFKPEAWMLNGSTQVPDNEYSEASQMKETQCLQHLEVNNDPRGKQKSTKRPPKNQFLDFDSDDNKHEQIEKDEEMKNETFFKRTKAFQDSEKTTSRNQEIIGNDSFGSENNPNLLKSWSPLLTFDGKDYHLVFEGILLNAVGRLMKRKFTTNHVVRRVSSKIIETVDHQFYRLVGIFYNTKHVVPKELLRQCRYGCPAKIGDFCATWLKLAGENNVIVERPQKLTTKFPQGIRRIIPPLYFWDG